ncbi:MAG: class I tRNA ligase family protein, partial [Bacteroidota bacterium]|nr:class I tRNA ligase family protein [Bacteroidota bacterium]
LKLLHPIMPFITEEIWHKMEPGRDGRSIMQEQLPELKEDYIDASSVSQMNFLQSLVDGVRTIQGEMNVPAGKSCDVVINCQSEEQIVAVTENAHFLKRLARIDEVQAGVELARPRLSATTVVAGAEVYVPLEGLIDVDVERNRLGKEITRITGLLKSIDSKLGNAKFLDNAPADVVEREKDKQANFRRMLEQLETNLKSLEND